MSSCSLVDRAPTQCSKVVCLIPVGDSDFFLFPTLVSCWSIGHFRVLLHLCFKTSLSAKPFIWKWVPHVVSFSCKSTSHFHKNGFALRLALKQRHKGTRKWPIHLSHFITELKITHLKFHLSVLAMTWTVLILAVCRRPVTYELSSMTVLSMSSHSSVDRVPAQCLGGHGSIPFGTQIFFFVSSLCGVDQFPFHILLPSLKFTIFTFTYHYCSNCRLVLWITLITLIVICKVEIHLTHSLLELFSKNVFFWTFWCFLSWISAILALIWSKMRLQHNSVPFLPLALCFTTLWLGHGQKSNFCDKGQNKNSEFFSYPTPNLSGHMYNMQRQIKASLTLNLLTPSWYDNKQWIVKKRIILQLGLCYDKPSRSIVIMNRGKPLL